MQIHSYFAIFALFLAFPLMCMSADQPPAKSGPAAVEFARVFEQWKGMLTKLDSLKTDYRMAEGAKRAEIEKQWKETMKQAIPMQDELIVAAEKAYKEAPNADTQVVDLLVGVLADWNARDDYERAAVLGKMLIDNKCADQTIASEAGIAAFNLADYDTAEAYFEQAKKNGKLTQVAEMDMANLPYYRKAWAREKQIREAEAKADNLPRVLIKTNRGDIELELFENEAPNSVANFISLVEKGFYNNKTFHRVLGGFVAQGGCPTGDGTGGPGYTIACECYGPDARMHFRGSLSMAHAGRDTGGSQFFLTFVPIRHLDVKHTVFGRVIKGFDVLAKLKRRDPQQPNPPEPDEIIEAKVLRKRAHDYVPKKVG